MKVYQINVTGRFSTGTIARNIQNKLLATGNESRFAFGYGGDKDENSFELCGVWHLRFDYRAQLLTGKTGILSKGITQKLIKDIKKFDPDIIHLHNIHGNFINTNLLLRFLGNFQRPVIITLHDCWFFTGGCYHFTVNNCEKWKTQCDNCEYNKGYLLKKIYPVEKRAFLEKSVLLSKINDLTIVAVSDWLNKTARESFLKEREILTIHNGIDAGIFRKKDASLMKHNLGLDGKKIALGVASTWSEKKGLLKWMELSDLLTDDYRFILVGLDSNQMQNVPKNIIALPRVKNVEDLVELYNLADVYVNLSLEETFGLPTVEAMACGTPVIVLNSTANPELVDDAVGIVINEYTPENVVQAIIELSERKERMSADCIEKVKTDFLFEKMCDRYLELYKKIINQNGN